MKKTILLKTFICFIGALCYMNCNAQVAGKVKMRALNSAAIPNVTQIGGSSQFNFGNSTLQNLFDNYDLLAFEQRFPAANNTNHPLTESLTRVYTVTCNCDVEALINDLETNASQYYDRILKSAEIIPLCRTLPNDPYSNEPDQGSNDYWSSWFLSMLDIYNAYCLFDSDSETVIAITDMGFKDTHEDLQDNIIANFAGSSNTGGHGTAVAGLCSPVTNNGIGVAGVGNNCPMTLYGMGMNNILQASNDGARVVNCSWFRANFSCNASHNPLDCRPFDPDEQDLINVVTAQGTVVVAAAANGSYGSSCNAICSGSEHTPVYPASYNNVISVSSLDREKRFSIIGPMPPQYCGTGFDLAWSTHNDFVDVVAPGHCTFTTDVNDLGEDSYGWGYHGTSLAAPLVSGICGLILDANPNLTPQQVRDILVNTGEDVSNVSVPTGIPDNASYYPNSPVPPLVNAYRAVLSAKGMTELDDTEHIISGNVTWNTPRYAKEDIYVFDGATLTIESELLLCTDKRITVFPGGHLKINGGHLYSNCGRWQGITVLGNSQESQYPYLGHKQGKVTINNKAIIENANEAVSLYLADGSLGLNSTGGILTATSSTFKNNIRSIFVPNYQNYDPYLNIPAPNFSRVIDCTFTVDEGNDGDFEEHIRLFQVDGIRFKGNTFDYTSLEPGTKGIGINSIDANFYVEGYCTTGSYPCLDWQSSTFAGLSNGINASSISSLYNFSVDNAVFKGNHIGVNSTAVITPKVTRSSFNVGTNTLGGRPEIGIRINGGTGYIIEENKFTGTSPSEETIGILVRNTGNDDNQIYSNNFEKLHCANLSNGNNRDEINYHLGLNYYCNENQNNLYDFAIPYQLVSNPNLLGIARFQGAQGDPAGNTFSPNASISEDDIFNYSGNLIEYHYFLFEPTQTPLDNSLLVQTIGEQVPNPCIVNYPKVQDDPPGVKSQFWSNRSKKESLENALYSLIDGGDTEGLKTEINQTGPSESSKLKNKLLKTSPYLSTEVLKTAGVNTSIISHADMFDLLKSNSDELVNTSLLDYMANKPDPMPQNMIQQLSSIPFTPTNRTELESQISFYNNQIQINANLLVHYYLTDSLEQNKDSVKTWLENKENLAAEFALVDYWLHQDNTSKAIFQLNNIPITYNLAQNQAVEYMAIARLPMPSVF